MTPFVFAELQPSHFKVTQIKFTKGGTYVLQGLLVLQNAGLQ